jgi:Bacterial Ig-like domain
MKPLGLRKLAAVPALVGISLAVTMGIASAATAVDNPIAPTINPGGTGIVQLGLHNSATTAAIGTPGLTFQAPSFATFTSATLPYSFSQIGGVVTNSTTTDCVLSDSNQTLTCNANGAVTFSVPAANAGGDGNLYFQPVIAVSPSVTLSTAFTNGTVIMTTNGGFTGVTSGLGFTSSAIPAPTVGSPASGATTSSTPTITGTGTAGDPVSVTNQNGNTVCTATVAANGTYSCTPTTPLASGANTLTATETNSNGFTQTGAPVPVTVAAAATPATITGPASGSTVTPTPTVTGTGTAGDPVTVTDQNGNTVCTTTIAANGTFSCTPATPLAVGSDTLTATVTNANGSTTAGPADAFTVVAASGSPMANPEVAGGLGAGVLALGGIELVRRRRAGRRVAA